MKIHIHTPAFFPRLVGMTYAADMRATLLAELGAQVTVIAPGSSSKAAADPHAAYGVRQFDVRGSGLPWSRLGGEIDALLAFTERERPDIVISEGWFTPATCLLPRLRERAGRTVLSSHGSAEIRLQTLHPAQIARSAAYALNEAILAPAILRSLSAAIILADYRQGVRFRDVAWFEKRGIPTYVCPNPAIYAPADRGRTLSDDSIRLLHIGEMSANKNQLAVLQALAQLPAHYGATLVYPEDTPYAAEVRQEADRLGLTPRVRHVMGRQRHELEPFYDEADLLLITSFTEAQPITASDALAKGIPFISTPVGCMPSYRGGRVTERGHLAAAIADATANRSRYEALSQEAIAFYRGSLSRETAKDAMQAMLTALS